MNRETWEVWGCTGIYFTAEQDIRSVMTVAVKLTPLFFPFFFLTHRDKCQSCGRNGFDSVVHITVMSDGAGDRQGETGAVTQKGLKLDGCLKTPD